MAGRRRVSSSVLRGRGVSARRGARTYRRDSRGRFASTGAASSSTGGSGTASSSAGRKRTHRRAAVGAVVAVGAVAASQARPASRSRTTIQRRRIVKTHVGRARVDHARQISRRNRVFPTAAVTGSAFNAKAARAEGRNLTKGYRKQVRTVRKRARKSRQR